MWPLPGIISSDAAIEAAKNGDIDEMKKMMLGEVGKCGCITALLEAVMTGEVDMVKNLIAAGVDVNERDKSTGDTGSTALQWAAGIGSWNEEIMNALVAAGANIDDEVALQQPGGRTPLQTAARSGHPKTVEYLVRLGARVNAPAASSFGRTALQAAAEFGRDQIVEYLTEKGADVNAPPAEYGGRTALEAATENDHRHIVKYLINKGAYLKFSSTDGSGCTALNIAIEKGHTEIMAIIYANLGTENCYNLLVSAFKNRDYNVAKAILCTGEIDFNRQNDYGNTPLHLAVKNSWHEIVSLILEEQVNTEIRNTENKTPLHLILHQQDSDMAHIFLQHGASMTGITATDARNLFGMRGRDYGLLLLEQDESTGGRMLNMVGGWSGPSPGHRSLWFQSLEMEKC